MTKFLVVDDEYYNRYIIIEILKKTFGDACQIETAADGVSAMDIAQSFLPDIIFLDILLPELDGTTVFNNLRSQDCFRNTHFIILSALDLSACGIEEDDYCRIIQKPFQIKHIIKILNKCLLTPVY